jgi:hypothetical protein
MSGSALNLFQLSRLLPERGLSMVLCHEKREAYGMPWQFDKIFPSYIIPDDYQFLFRHEKPLGEEGGKIFLSGIRIVLCP